MVMKKIRTLFVCWRYKSLYSFHWLSYHQKKFNSQWLEQNNAVFGTCLYLSSKRNLQMMIWMKMNEHEIDSSDTEQLFKSIFLNHFFLVSYLIVIECSLKCCCSPCSSPILFGFLIGALVAGIALATVLSVYLVDTGKYSILRFF